MHAFGSALEADVKRVTDKAKNEKSAAAAAQRTFARWMDDGKTPTRGLYRDPAGG